MNIVRSHVLVCGGTGCTSSGSVKLIDRFNQQLAALGLEKEVRVIKTGCFGLCEAGPVVIVYPEGTFYSHVHAEDVDEIVSEHLHKAARARPGVGQGRHPSAAIANALSFTSTRRAWRCATAALSIRKTSTNTSPLTATWR